MASFHLTTGKLSACALVVVITVVCLSGNPAAIFDKAIGLALIVPVACLLIGFGGMLLGRVGIVLATALSLVWSIAVAIG